MAIKIKVVLNNGGGELDSETFEIAEGHEDYDEAVNVAASAIIEGWTLSIGDTITIREV